MAAEYLIQKGYSILERNWRFHRGEIDIIAETGESLVFIEVKERESLLYGYPEEAINLKKARQIRSVASAYIRQHDVTGRNIRLDAITILKNGSSISITHYENAM